MRKKMVSLIVILTLAAMMIAGCGANKETKSQIPEDSSAHTSEEEGELTVRIGYFATNTGTPQLHVASKLGYFEEELGNNVKVELIPFANGPAANEAFIAGQLDFINGIGDLPLLNGWRNGIDTLVISKITVAGEKLGLVVSNASGIKSVEDLKGKKIGVYLGTCFHKNLLGILHDHGLSSGDVNLVNVDNTDTGAASLESGELDAYYCPTIYHVQYIEDNKIGYLLEDSTEHPNYGYFVGTTEFINAHEEETVGILKALNKASQYISEDSDEAAKIVAEALEADEGVAKKSLEYGDYSLNLEDKDIQNIYDSEKFLQSIKAADVPVEDSYIKSHIDLSYLRKVN